jgi:hypothetical protein
MVELTNLKAPDCYIIPLLTVKNFHTHASTPLVHKYFASTHKYFASMQASSSVPLLIHTAEFNSENYPAFVNQVYFD